MGKEKRKWFQKGAFEDGYQIGDVYRALRATGKDVTTNFFAGATGLVEKAIDTGAYVAGGVGGLLGADEFKDKTAKFIKKDIINEEKVGSVLADVVGQNVVSDLIDRVVIGKDYRENYDDYSLLGEKSDSLVQSGGQLAAQIALQTFAGVPWWVTTGVTSFGGSVEESLNDDASYGKAGISAAITTGADILTEKLFGGSGLGETGLIKLDKLTQGISNKAVKALVDWGLDVGAEGFEEVSAAFVSRLGKALTYEKEDTWREILTNEKSMDRYIKQVGNILFGKEARDEYKEAGISGMILGGGANANNVVKSVKEGADYRTGLTENEQKVFDNKYKKNIDEAKVKNYGKELDGKEKRQIYNNTVNEIKSGEVDAQTVEEALGGEEYSAYKNALGNYNTLQQKLNQIKIADSNVKTQEQAAGEIEQRLEETRLQAEKLKNILENKVKEKIDTDNIHLKNRESYLFDSYIKGIQKPIDNTLNDSNSLINTDENEVIAGMWEDSLNTSKDNVEKSQLESVEKYSGNGIMNAVALSKYVNSSDPLYINATKIKPISNYEDMVIHGDAFGFQINNKDGKPIDNYNAVEFANILKEDPNYHGGNIRLVSCETGSVEFGAAQILANELGVEVLAPTDIVWVTMEGEMIVGPSVFENTGGWKIFKPRRRK